MIAFERYRRPRVIAIAAVAAAQAFIAGPAAAGEISDAVKETGVMTVGVRADYLPFSKAVGEGSETTFSGFDVDLMRAVADRIGVKASFVVVEPDVIIPMVAEGIVQTAPGLNHRMSWERVIDFSVTYLVGGTIALVPASSGIYGLASLRAKPVAVVAGTDLAAVSKKIPELNALTVETPQVGLSLMTGGEVRALIGDFKDLVSLKTQSERPATLRIIGEPIATVPVSVGVPPYDGTWREMVDRALMDLWISGAYAEIYRKWFGDKATVRIPLSFTMEIWPN